MFKKCDNGRCLDNCIYIWSWHTRTTALERREILPEIYLVVSRASPRTYAIDRMGGKEQLNKFAHPLSPLSSPHSHLAKIEEAKVAQEGERNI